MKNADRSPSGPVPGRHVALDGPVGSHVGQQEAPEVDQQVVVLGPTRSAIALHQGRHQERRGPGGEVGTLGADRLHALADVDQMVE